MAVALLQANKAAKVQLDHRIFFLKDTRVYFQTFLWQQNGCFLKIPGDISSHFCGDQNKLFFMGGWTISIHDPGDQNRYSNSSTTFSQP